MEVEARLESGSLAPERELRQFLDDAAGDGASVSFVGVARPAARDGAEVIGLYLDHYPGMTEASLAAIAAAASQRFSDARIRVVHRCGAIAPGEPIVFAAAASRHRREAFDAADYLMDRLKSEAAFWKREDRPDGSTWVEPTDQDRADLAGWNRHAGD